MKDLLLIMIFRMSKHIAKPVQVLEWFGTACCPANIARLVASLGNYIYAKSDDAIYVNLFVGSNTTIPLKSGNVGVKMETNYPWDGKVKLNIDPAKNSKFSLY